MARKPPPSLMTVRLARLHARLLISIAIGVAVALASFATTWALPTKLLAGWDTGIFLYLVLSTWMMLHSDVAEIRRRASVQDEGALALLLLSACAVIASIAAIIAELGSAQSGEGWGRLALGMGTIVLSWLFVHTIYALHYAHEYYGERSDAQVGGLNFPGRAAPDYWDFLYFSFVIAMTSQVSDVAITSKVIRRVATLHGVFSFFLNLSVLALTVNIVSNLIKPG